MYLPSRIDLQVICENESNLADIIVRIEVQAGRKNPYYIYFPKTTPEGRTTITAEDFRGQFEDYWEEGLMDYNGSVETASQFVTLELFSRENMLLAMDVVRVWPLLKHEKEKWQSRDEMIGYFLSCRNSEFSARPQSAEIRENETIRFVISKKAAWLGSASAAQRASALTTRSNRRVDRAAPQHSGGAHCGPGRAAQPHQPRLPLPRRHEGHGGDLGSDT